MKKLILVCAVIVLATVSWNVVHSSNRSDQQGKQVGNTFDKSAESLNEASSPWLIVNKQRPLQPATYVPANLVVPDVPLRQAADGQEMQLRADAARALEELVAAAQKDGLELMLSSAYRSYDYQKGLYDFYVSKQGRATADTQSARPGHSEHQTGLAVDLEPVSRKCEVEACFADLPEGKWVAAHAYKFGYVIRYQQGKDTITGYTYEPWHIRFVGKALAAELHTKGNPTLEEFFGLGSAATY